MLIGGLIAGLLIFGLFLSMLGQQPPKDEEEPAVARIHE